MQNDTINNGYFVTFNLQNNNQQRLLVINRDDVLNLVPTPRAQDLAIPGTSGGVQDAVLPADVDGWAFPPFREPGILMATVPVDPLTTSNTLRSWRVEVDWSAPA